VRQRGPSHLPQSSCGTATFGLSRMPKGQRWGGEIAMAKFYIKRLKTRAILSPSRLIRCTCTFRPEPISSGHHARLWRGPFQSGPGQTRSSTRSSTVHTVVVTLRGRAGKKRNDMDSAKRCRDQSAECLRLMKLAQSETEARVLRDLAHSWVRLANQTDRYTASVKSNGPHRGEVMPLQGTGVAPRSGSKFGVAHQRFR
jgi:hypothetical protein